MTRFGAHIVLGPRNGYKQFAGAKPAVCLFVDQDPAETEQESGGHTVTIFRADSIYGEAPPGYSNHPDPAALARQWYPALKNKWLLNHADYYQVSNEQGGGEGSEVESNLLHLVAFEREMMRLANADGFKLCVLNLAGGSPGDVEIWRRVCLPFIVEAWQARNIYGRHAYGDGDLVQPDGSVVIGNPSRPFEELGYLRQAGAAGGIAITECGLDAGFGFPGVERFVTQHTGYERLLRPYPEFIGECGYTLGKWGEGELDANWQDALPSMTAYLQANPSPAWTWPEPTPPPAGFRAAVWPVPSLRINQWFAANPQNYQQYGLPGHDGTDHRAPTGTPVKAIAAGTVYAVYTGDNYGIQVRVHHGNGHKTVYAHLLSASVVEGQAVTAGQVVGLANNTGNSYGPHLHLAYKRDGQTYTDPAGNVWPSNLFDPWLCLSPLLEDYLNTAGLTGWAWAASTLKHPHFPAISWGYGNNVNLNLRRTPDSSQPPIGVIPAGVPFKITGPIQGGYYPVRALLTDVAPAGLDMGKYFLPASGDYGRLFTLVNNWGGGDERTQLQRAGDLSYVVKNSQWERRLVGADYIDLQLDTSPGGGEYYTIAGHWLPRFMEVGQVFTRTETVTFRRKDNCQPVAGKPPYTSTSQIKLEHHYPTWTSQGGVVLNDVVVLAWLVNGNVDERYVVAAGLGLVTWQKWSGQVSWISELLPAGTPNLVREAGCFG